MKGRFFPAVVATVITLISLAWTRGTALAEPVLHVYTWADYIKPDIVKQFEKAAGCRVKIDTFDSNESMYAKIKSGAKGYDVITPSSYMAKVMHDQGLLLDLTPALLPNRANVDVEYLRSAMDKDVVYSVPYMLTNTGLAVLKSRVREIDPTWAMLDRSDLKGRMTMLNDMRETIGAALKFLGFSLNTRNETELEQAKAVVVRWKKNLAKFENEQYKTGLASGEFLLVHGYSGDIVQAQLENDDVQFVAPREGLSIASDDLVIAKDAAQPELAHRFINFLHDPRVAAANTEFITYLCPNKPSYDLLSDSIRKNPAIFLDPGVKKKSEVIEDLGADNAKYTKVWDEIKAAPLP